MLTLLVELAAITSASSARYVVEGFTLGEPIQLHGESYQSYECNPSERFEGFIWCARREPRRTSLGEGVFSSSILHDGNGTAVYLMAHIEPVSINRSVVRTEIDRLSRQMNERPKKIEWFPQRTGLPAAVIALWGKIELRKLDETEIANLGESESSRRGELLDLRFAGEELPVYQIAGGAGYLYFATFDRDGHGQRHYVASDASIPAIKKFEPALEGILQEDQSRASNDYGLWPKVAETTRNLALDASPSIANATLDKVFDKFASKKLRSHIWSLLPLSSLHGGGLADYVYVNRIPIYGPKTKYPHIRLNIEHFLAQNPSEPFAEFLYYTIGEFDKALQANPNSIIKPVVAYVAGFKALESLLQDIRKVARKPEPDSDWGDWSVNETLKELNQRAQLNDPKLLGEVVPNFAKRAAIAKPYFETVLRDQSSSLGDDAAYMLGWLAFHQGKFREAVEYTSQALRLGTGDYAPAATVQLARILRRLPPRERMTLLEANPVAAQGLAIPVLFEPIPLLPGWCVAILRTAYREFNFRLAIEMGQNALIAAKVPLDRMPVTTDTTVIGEALRKIENLSWQDVGCFKEIIYLIEAYEEILDYETYLKTVVTDRPDNVAKRAREIILKYKPESQDTKLGEAVRLIDMTLDSVPKTIEYAALREWLYYRKVRNLVQFNPAAVPKAVAAMEGEFPISQLMQHALAEQIYAEGARLEDIDAAEKTFRKLVNNFRTGSAVDNAYTWMAISYHCAGRSKDAERIDEEIVRLFPMTRHATYARDRLSNSGRSNCKLSIFSNDAWKNRWGVPN
jgi:tetratricopeptide (TPR) repeat protein